MFIKLGAVPIELLEPLDDKPIWAKYIADKGEDTHYVAPGVSNHEEMVATF